MTNYEHNKWRYNCIDISSKGLKFYKVYRTYGNKQDYLHFKGDDLYNLVDSAANGNEEHKEIVEGYFEKRVR